MSTQSAWGGLHRRTMNRDGFPTSPNSEDLPLVRDLGVLLTLAAFTPYVLKSVGLRADHVVIYCAALLGAVRLATSPVRRPVYLGPVLVFFGLATLWTLAVTLFNPIYDVDTYRVVADADHYLRPMAITVAMIAWLDVGQRSAALTSLRRVCLLLLGLLAINALLTSLSLFVDLRSVFEPFRPDNTLTLNVADRAAQLGRFTGIFNQPLESGIAYSLGLFAWAYLYVGKWAAKPYALAHVTLALILLGGLLPVSKAFLLGGVPLFLIYWIAGGGLWNALRLRTLPIVIVAGLGAMVVIASWSGSDFIGDQLHSAITGDSGLVSSLSAGRFGSEGSVSTVFADVAVEAPLTGFGLASFYPLDSAYLMYFIHGGALMLLAYLLLLGWLLEQAWRRAAWSREGRVLAMLAIYMMAAGIGAPVASVVRSSTVLWIMIALCVRGSPTSIRLRLS